MKYNVYLEYWKNIEVEAETEEKALYKAQIELTNDPFDYFSGEDDVASLLAERFNENHKIEV